MKPAFAAFVSVLVGIGLGLGLYAALDLGRASGRDPWPLLASSAPFLVLGVFAYRRWFHATALPCAAGLGVYVALVGAGVAWLAGTGMPRLYAEWVLGLAAATLVPWFAGFFAAGFLRRPRH